jgi:cytochrome c553
MLAASHAAIAAGVADTLEQRITACTGCHGKHGEGSQVGGVTPRISAMPARYLRDQLINFRDGRRHYPPMTTLVASLSDSYLEEIATYFANLPAVVVAAAPSSLSVEDSARAEALVRRGDEARRIPSCTSCHGGSLTGVQPSVPGLTGLSRDYIRSQLGAWRSGVRRAAAPDCMARIVERLATDDISVISSWLAARPVSFVGGRPAVTFPGKPPLECGSTPLAIQEGPR